MALLNSSSKISGSTNASASANRSLTSWINSFRACENIRRISILRGYLALLPRLLHYGDEHIFQRVTFLVDMAHLQARVTQFANHPLLPRGHIRPRNQVQAVAKQRYAP